MCARDYAVIWLKLHIAQAASNHFIPKTIICIPEHIKTHRPRSVGYCNYVTTKQVDQALFLYTGG